MLDPVKGEHDRRASRMAMGGKLRSESRVKRYWDYIGEVGGEPVPEPPSEIPGTWGSTESEWNDTGWDWMGGDL
jgi:hypothetical protein